MLTDLWPTRRNPWLQDVIDDLRLEQDGMCAICGRSLDTEPNEVDHVVPFRWGGGNERENIQLTHMTCNRAKGSEVDPKALLLYLEDRWMNRC